MTLTITPEVEALLRQELNSGRFRDPNELIATALAVLADSTPRDLHELDAVIQEGIDSAERGEVYRAEEARAHLASLRAKL